jgi:putative NADH-flavin reductase
MSLQKIALVGANGNLGTAMLNAFLSEGLKVTVLLRESSKSASKLPSSDKLQISRIPNDLEPLSKLSKVLSGHDALVISVSSNQLEESYKLIDAAIDAGVKRIIPADFGSVDSADPRSLDLLPIYRKKAKVRKYLEEREGKGNGKLSWTSLVPGHFFDWGLLSGLLHFNIAKSKALIFDGGQKMFSATTLDDIGLAVAKILALGENDPQTKNRIVYIQSVRTCQNDLLRCVEAITGRKFDVETLDSEEYIRQKKAKLYDDQENMDADIVEELVGVEGIVNADWEKKDGFLNKLLGFPISKDLQDEVKRALSKGN